MCSLNVEGIPDAPLRTVELIKRPLELREPATKLLYMASLGLYPKTGTKIVCRIRKLHKISHFNKLNCGIK